MIRRDFIRTVGLVSALAVAIASSSAIGTVVPGYEASAKPYMTLKRLDVEVAGAGGVEKMTFFNGAPQFVPFTNGAMAVAFEEVEDNDNLVKMVLYRPDEDGSLQITTHFYAGRDSVQTLMRSKLSFSISFVD